MDNQKIYETWKPLRNYLSKMGIRDSLEAIWWYSWYLPFDATNNSPQPLPSMSYDMRIIRSAKYPLLIWELERLAEEMILNGKNFVLSPDESLKSGRKFCRAVQRLKDINQAASKITLPNISNPLDLLFPITHQQFKYQGHSHDNIAMIRYYRIWSDDTVAKIVQERLGLSIKEILTTSLLMLSHYTNDPAIKDIGASLYGFGVSSEKVQRIIGMIARPLSDIKEEIVHTHILDETYEYQYNPLIAYPVVDFGHDGDSCLVCPIPIDLQLRLLNGLYYDLCNDSRFDDKYDFGNALGDSFQQYVGDILSATLGPSNVYPEEEEPEKKCDWIVDQATSFLLVECKIKRPNLQSYTSVLDSKPLDGQLDILSDAVIQAYEAYNNYRYNKFKSPQYHYDGSKKASICVVTMEDWYIIGNIRLRLEELVKEKMRKKKIDESLLEGVPFIVMSISEFEEFSYYLKKYDAHELISKHCNDFHGYTVLAIRELISEEFLKCYKYIFQEQFRDCFTEELGSIVDMSDSFIRPPE